LVCCGDPRDAVDRGRIDPTTRVGPPAKARLDADQSGRLARTLAAWSVGSSATFAALTALWGVLADLIGPRAAIAAAGLLMLATPL
jgi:hypothetical protein